MDYSPMKPFLMMLRIFELRFADDEKVWISAATNIHAIQQYCIETDTDLSDFEGDEEIHELSPTKWGKHFIKPSDEDEGEHEPISFKQWMKENKDAGIIAGTIWN